MPFKKGQSGNPTGKPKQKPWTEALRLVANDKGKDNKLALRRLAETTFEMALAGDINAIKEIGNRLEGTPVQSIQHSGDDNAPLVIEKIIVDPKIKD